MYKMGALSKGRHTYPHASIINISFRQKSKPYSTWVYVKTSCSQDVGDRGVQAPVQKQPAKARCKRKGGDVSSPARGTWQQETLMNRPHNLAVRRTEAMSQRMSIPFISVECTRSCCFLPENSLDLVCESKAAQSELETSL